MNAARIECEVRCFIGDDRYAAIAERLRLEAERVGVDEQETWYFDGPADLRIQRGSRGAKVWLKKGAMHSDAREEIEVAVERERFGDLAALFAALGYGVKVKWFRRRESFRWGGIDVALDDTRGYGRILELEKVCGEGERDAVLEELHARLASLGLEPTPKEEFSRRFEAYLAGWREFIGEGLDREKTAV